MRIQARIFTGFFIVVAVGLFSLLYWIADDLKPQYRKVTEEPLVDASQVLASVAAATVRDGRIDRDLFRRVFNDVYSRPFSANIFDYIKGDVDFHVYITDAYGKVLFDSFEGKDEGKDYSQWNDVKRTLEGEYGARTSQVNKDDPLSSVMYVASPVIVDGAIVGVLSVGNPTNSSNRFVEDARRQIIIMGLITGLLIVLVGMLLSRRITAPINRLTAYARAVRDGRRARLPDLGGGETRELGEAFDEMRTSLEGKQYVEKYIQTLTHEIKSPLSAIHGAIELLTEDVPPDQRSRFLSNIRDETERIKEVVEKLLLLSSLEKLNNVEDVRVLNMRELLGGIGESLFPVLKSKGLTLNISGDDDATVEGDPFLVRQALLNLLQNAIEFSEQGGAVSADLSKNNGSVILTVRDRGSGIPDYALEKIFERFYSLKRPDTGKKSSGLGLCLVREVATLHQGSIGLVNARDGGTIATLTFPQKFHQR